MSITTRMQALALGLPRYSTGEPCKRGHLSERRTDSGACLECIKANRDTFKAKNADAFRALITGMAPFGYHLHPDDVAAALAYCQALDMQRGRAPQTLRDFPKVAAVKGLVEPTWEEFEAERLKRFGHLTAAQPTAPRHEFKP